jgi:hypothetical protein
VKDLESDTTKEAFEAGFTQVSGSCVEYGDDVDFDTPWKIARIFAVVAPLAGAFLAICLYVAPCMIFFSRTTYNAMACLFLVLLPGLQGLTLLVLTSDVCKDNPVIENRFNQAIAAQSSSNTDSNSTTPSSGINEDALRSIYDGDCEWDWGTYCNLLSMILFFLTGIIMLLMGPNTRPELANPPEIQEVTYQQTTDETTGEPKIEEVDVTKETIGPGGPSWASTAHKPTEQAKLY